MNVWLLRQDGFDPADTLKNGNRFLLGNGYMGYRGTADECGSAQFAAVNLAGVYDRYADKWREPVNAPNALFAKLFVDGEAEALYETEPLSHSQSLDYRRGVYSRDTEFSSVRLKSERIVSMADAHLLASRITMCFRRDAEAELVTGISTDIWDINGSHLFDFSHEAGCILNVRARTGELNIPVAAAQAVCCDFQFWEVRESGDRGVFRHINFSAKAGETYTVTLFGSVFTGADTNEPCERAMALSARARSDGYLSCLSEHERAWNKIWENCGVEITGCDEAARALNASLYHLNSIAPRHESALSIPARGLSGQTYKGAIFWDSEIFMLPVFAHTDPNIAKSLLRYRIDTLSGARKKAAEYGFRGAFYPWESQEGGAEGCTDYNVTDVFTHRPVRTYFRDKQIHISADIAYALWRYYEMTGDCKLLRDGGAEVILECARFYLSRARRQIDGDDVELWDVIGPDEYHERVNNNAFTNQMAAYCMQSALKLYDVFADEPDVMEKLVEKLDYAEDMKLLRTAAEKLLPRFGDGGLIEQFDGYLGLEDCSLDTVRSRVLDEREYWGTNHGVAAHTQIIKQADVIAMMALFPERFSDETVRRNWFYYEPRTEHGSSLSACMYALTACRIGRPDLAWEHFMKTASIDVTGESKQWAGEVYIGGTHPAANGGAWLIAVLGFAGLQMKDGELKLEPKLPEEIESLRFSVTLSGQRRVVTVTHDGYSVDSACS